jgi:hypothetical protein
LSDLDAPSQATPSSWGFYHWYPYIIETSLWRVYNGLFCCINIPRPITTWEVLMRCGFTYILFRDRGTITRTVPVALASPLRKMYLALDNLN